MTYTRQIDKTADNQQPAFLDIQSVPHNRIQTIPNVTSLQGIWSPNKVRFRILSGTSYLYVVRHERRYHPYTWPRDYFQRPKPSGTKFNTGLYNKPPNSITSDVKALGPVMNIQNSLMNFGVSYLTESDYRQMREWKSEFETSLTVPSSITLSYTNTDYENPFSDISIIYSETQLGFIKVNKDDLDRPSQTPPKASVEQKPPTGDTNLIVQTLDTGETRKEKENKDHKEIKNEEKAQSEDENQNRQDNKLEDKADTADEAVNDNKLPEQDTSGDERGLQTDPDDDDELDLNDESLSHRNAEVCTLLGLKYEGDELFYKKLLEITLHDPQTPPEFDKQMSLTNEGLPVTHIKTQDDALNSSPIEKYIMKPKKYLTDVIRLPTTKHEKPYTDNTDSTNAKELKRKNSEPTPVPRRILFLNPSKRSRLEEGEANMKADGSNAVEARQLIKTKATSSTKPLSSGRMLCLNPSKRSEREEDVAFGKKEDPPVVTGNFIPPYRRKFAAGSAKSSTSTGLMSSSSSKGSGFTRDWQNTCTQSSGKDDIAAKVANERTKTSEYVGNSPMNRRIVFLNPNKHEASATSRGDKESHESFVKDQHGTPVKSRLGYQEHVPVKSRLGYKGDYLSHDSYNRQYNYTGATSHDAYNRQYDDTDTYSPPVHGKRRRRWRKRNTDTNANPDRNDRFRHDTNTSRQHKKGRIVLKRRFNY